MDTTETTTYTASPSHRRALLRRLGLGLLAALLTVLALGGLGYPDPSLGSVIDATAACTASPCAAGAAA